MTKTTVKNLTARLFRSNGEQVLEDHFPRTESLLQFCERIMRRYYGRYESNPDWKWTCVRLSPEGEFKYTCSNGLFVTFTL